MKRLHPSFLHLIPLVALSLSRILAAEDMPDLSALPPPAEGPVDFARDIQPLFAEHCVKCHGAKKQKGGLRLDNRTSAFQGGDHGEVIVAGQSGESRLLHLVGGLEPDKPMPPKGGPLAPQAVAKLRAWIDQGADWPDDGKVERLRSDHWSLQPLRKPEVPGDAPHPLDAFVRARLAQDGLAPSPEADRATLIRRLSFGLLGLPPTPEEIDAFVGDSSPDAYPNLVDRLLASPQYGERWARHWLDVARFTESQGFEYDKLRDNAWHYRDYVIQAFNEDKPYDRFMREQVAGDVLEPVTREGIVATSLLVCGPWDEAGNAQSNATQRAITREDELEDLLGVVGQSFLGLTINCARCHAHKFDPIPHDEYYRLKSVFEGVKHGERPLANADAPKPDDGQRANLEAALAAARATVARLEAKGSARTDKRTPEAPPAALARWNFDATDAAVLPGTPHGGALIENGRLKLPAEGAYFQSAPLPRDVREKTLEAWVSLASLDQGGGAAISIENKDGSIFDAIVFGERHPRKWMAGSNGFTRTRDLEIPDETAAPDTLIHLAVVYHADNRIALYRNGEPLGDSYTPASPLQTFRGGDARVLLGMRHTGATRAWLVGEIDQAALYDRALDDSEIAAAFRSGSGSPPLDQILAALTPDERRERETSLEDIRRARAALAALDAPPAAVSYVGVRVQPEPTRRLLRGEVTSPAEVVAPGALSAIAALDPEFGLAPDAPEAERRLRFAEWLTDPRHPLPARVMANRVWHLHFGQGIVATPNDFGQGGTPPTHPELLDWLATEFIGSGWSVKALHRLILNSDTYRQTSTFRPEAAANDVDNQLLWRFPPRRLEAESIRDAMLAVSGEINLTAGGPSFRPFDPLPFPANAYAIADKTGPEFNRRTVYRMNVNSGKEPLLDAFDCPDPSVKTPRRSVTTTPLQALGLMNNSFVQRQVAKLAERALHDADGDLPGAIRAAYRRALGRPPTPSEQQRDAKAVDERGLDSLCWALLNSTEFVYVR